MFNMNKRFYNPQSQIQSVSHQVSWFHPQASHVVYPQPSMVLPQSYQVIHPQSFQVIHPQLSQVIHQQTSQAPVISLQSSVDPIQVDSSLVVPYFLPTDDPLERLNKALAFMSTILALSYPSFDNQLETSPYTQSKKIQCLKQQMLLAQLQEAGIQLSKDQLVILADTGERIDLGPGAFTVTTNALFQADGVEVNNQDNMDNYMINQVVQAMPSSKKSSVVNYSETEITSDSNIIPYSYQVINYTKINLDNKSVNDSLTAKLERYKEQVKALKEGQNVYLKSKDNVSDSCEQSVEIDRLKQTLSEHVKVNESLMRTITLLKNDFKKEESRNIDREIALEKKIKQLDNIVFKRDQLAQTKAQQLEPKLYDGNVIKNTSVIVIPNSEETLMLAEEIHLKMLLKQHDLMMLNSMNSSDPSPSCRPTKVEVPKELPKVSMVNTSLKKLKHHLAGFDVVVKERTTATAITEGSWGFEHTKACFRDEIIPFVKALKDIFNTFDQYLIDELTEVQNVFHQMEQAVEQHRLESKTFEVKMNKVLNENERLLEQVISKDIVNIIVNSSVDNAYVNVHECEKCLKLETELLNKKDFIEKEIYDKLFRSYTTLENISSL
ncbi:hypothetical protein Tco_1516111 [Tanacetum coccineum]